MSELQLVWGWQPALYLFLGGMGAGSFVIAGIMFLFDRENNKKAVSVSMWASAISLGLGLLLLLSELVFPLRGLLLWQSFSNGGSWMTFGAWAALAAIVVFGLMAVLTTEKLVSAITNIWSSLPQKIEAIRTVLTAIGIVLGVCVAVYTGMLLMSVPGVPFWSTLLLPCLFTVSAIDTGVALVEIVAVGSSKKDPLTHKAQKMLESFVVVLVLLELVVIAAFFVTMLSGNVGDALMLGSSSQTAVASAELLLTGALAPYFWVLVLTIGLAVPLILAIAGLIRKAKLPKLLTVAGATGALIGGCALRFLILMAGTHADFVADTILKLLL